MTTEQKLYAQCLNLIPDERPAFIKLHVLSGLTAEGFWRYTCGHKPNKPNRTAILALQDYRCALCKQPPTGRVCLDRTGQMVCNQCNQLLAAWRPAQARGVGEAELVAFENNTDTE